MTQPNYAPGDVVWTDFDPASGRDQAGRRPALVVSAQSFNEATAFLVVCPITSRIRPFPSSVVLPDGMPVRGEILLSAIRSIDSLTRPVRPAGFAVPSFVLEEVRLKLVALITT